MVLQRGKKGVWYAVFRDRKGRQLWRRLEATTRKAALAAAIRMERKAKLPLSTENLLRKIYS